MTLDESAVYFGSNDALSMDLTPLDQPLPKNTYPVKLEAKCSKAKKGGSQFHVRVESKPGAPFDILEGTNRVVALPGNKVATSTKPDKHGSFVLSFGNNAVKELAYQRLSVDGSWSTVAKRRVTCK
jgi:hypothetical protein